MTNEIIFSTEHHIGLITLNRPEALNALNFSMISALQVQLTQWQDDPFIHAVVVRSACDRAFCAGGDVRAIYHLGRENIQQKMAFFKAEYRLNQFIHEFNKPYIAFMDGITMGGGVGISLHGSHPVASSRFIFAMPETGIGFYPDIGSSYLLSRLSNHMGVYLGLTGNRLNAQDAYGLGLVRYVISEAHFPSLLQVLIDSDLSRDSQQRVSDILRPFHQLPATSNLDSWAGMVNDCFQYDTIESIMTALSQGDWQQQVYQTLKLKAPLSLKIALAQLIKAKTMTLSECLQMDYGLTNHFMRDPNFDEGVRALLIDKDNHPHWQPQTVTEVSAEMVENYFQ